MGSGADSSDGEGLVTAAGWMSLASVYAAAYTAEKRHSDVSFIVQLLVQSREVNGKCADETRRCDTEAYRKAKVLCSGVLKDACEERVTLRNRRG